MTMFFHSVLIFQLAFQVSPGSADSYTEGVLLLEQGKLDAARTSLELAVKRTPANAQAWKALGVAAAMAGDYSAAEAPFAKACQLNAKLIDGCYFWARALYALNRFEPAIAVLKKLDDGQAGRTQTALGQAYEALGKISEAESSFQKALTAKDFIGESQLRYGIFLYRTGRLTEAGDRLQQALKLAPHSAEAAAELGRVRYQQGNLEEAETLLRNAVAWEPTRESARLLLDKVRKLQGVK